MCSVFFEEVGPLTVYSQHIPSSKEFLTCCLSLAERVCLPGCYIWVFLLIDSLSAKTIECHLSRVIFGQSVPSPRLVACQGYWAQSAQCLWFIFRVFLLLDRLSFMTYILCPNVLVTHSWGWIGECQSLSIRGWVMHTAPLGLQLLRDPPQSGLGLQRPSYRGVPSCVQGALRESCLWRGYVPEGWDLHASAHFFTMAGYPAAIAESEMYISQLLFTIALDTSHKPVARGHHTTNYIYHPWIEPQVFVPHFWKVYIIAVRFSHNRLEPFWHGSVFATTRSWMCTVYVLCLTSWYYFLFYCWIT